MDPKRSFGWWSADPRGASPEWRTSSRLRWSFENGAELAEIGGKARFPAGESLAVRGGPWCGSQSVMELAAAAAMEAGWGVWWAGTNPICHALVWRRLGAGKSHWVFGRQALRSLDEARRSAEECAVSQPPRWKEAFERGDGLSGAFEAEGEDDLLEAARAARAAASGARPFLFILDGFERAGPKAALALKALVDAAGRCSGLVLANLFFESGALSGVDDLGRLELGGAGFCGWKSASALASFIEEPFAGGIGGPESGEGCFWMKLDEGPARRVFFPWFPPREGLGRLSIANESLASMERSAIDEVSGCPGAAASALRL